MLEDGLREYKGPKVFSSDSKEILDLEVNPEVTQRIKKENLQ